jgi:hypothetical protein
MTQVAATERMEAEALLKTSCDRRSHIKSWRKELPYPRRWDFKRETAKYDPLPPKVFRKVLDRSLTQSHYHSAAHFFIPPVMSSLRLVIEASRNILELTEDWDDEKSPGYSESTWNRAVKFLSKNALYLWRRHKIYLEAPRILPGPDGSIDLHWRMPKRELLVNIPANAEEPASYYGDDREEGTENAIRGKSLDTSAHNEWIFLWLMK